MAICRKVFDAKKRSGKEGRAGGGDIGNERKIQKCRAAFKQNN